MRVRSCACKGTTSDNSGMSAGMIRDSLSWSLQLQPFRSSRGHTGVVGRVADFGKNEVEQMIGKAELEDRTYEMGAYRKIERGFPETILVNQNVVTGVAEIGYPSLSPPEAYSS